MIYQRIRLPANPKGCHSNRRVVFFTRQPDMIKITGNPIETEKVIAAAESLKAGAVNVCIGTVRDSSKGRPVRWLEYEAY
ncbi:MAG: molybdenum cofactor biosynthesis protein MoaE, partial [Bacteroidota bacterium]